MAKTPDGKEVLGKNILAEGAEKRAKKVETGSSKDTYEAIGGNVILVRGMAIPKTKSAVFKGSEISKHFIPTMLASKRIKQI